MYKKIIFLILLILFSDIVIAGKIDYRLPLYCSNSMYPTITCNKKVYVNTVNKNDNFVIGEIYCYRPDYSLFYNIVPGDCVLHRLISKVDDHYCFKGDNNYYEDPECVEAKYIQFKVVKII